MDAHIAGLLSTLGGTAVTADVARAYVVRCGEHAGLASQRHSRRCATACIADARELIWGWTAQKVGWTPTH